MFIISSSVMAAKKSFLLVLLFNLCFSAQIVKKNVRTQNWPCPLAVDIYPCECYSDENMMLHLDCSEVSSDIELQKALSTRFPFPDFEEFRIIKDIASPNNLDTFGPGLFGDLYFKQVTVKGTTLKRVQEETFVNSHKSLIQLDMANNQITEFVTDNLYSFESLRSIDLSTNNLKEFRAIHSDSLLSLSLAENMNIELFSNTLERAKNLKYINLDATGLTQIPEGLFSNLTAPTELHLSFNHLTELRENDINLSGSTINILSLTENKISSVIHDSIKGLSKNGKLLMNKNEMKELEGSVWRPVFDMVIPKEGAIDFSENPNIICGCDVLWIVTNETYWNAVTKSTMCQGNTYFHDISPDILQSNCL